MEINASLVHQKFGDIIPLNLSTPLEEVHTDLVKDQKYGKGVAGNKLVHRYETLPPSWDMDGIVWRKAVHIDLDMGSFFMPHRDTIRFLTTQWVRLNCFANHARPDETTYIVDGNIMHFEPTRWYAVNTSRVHWSFCFKPNTVHYVIDIDVSDPSTYEWFLSKASYCDRPNIDAGGAGYK